MIGDKLKLESGLEVEIKTITRREKRQIEGFAYKAYTNPEYVMLMHLDTVILATGLTEKEIEEKYTDEQINEIANLVSEQINLDNEQKKS